MALRFLNKKTHYFYFIDTDNIRKRYVLIFGDEINTLPGPEFKTIVKQAQEEKAALRAQIREMEARGDLTLK